ncbi:hypothetical protein SOVF_118370 [Spinacia oleracea]|nr:hypothetical protein SOVF_118370 [Spinacia oleracea]
MLSGIKLISRDQVDRGNIEESSGKKDRRKKKGSKYSTSDDEEHEKIRKGSKKKKWYSSDEYSASSSADDVSDNSLGGDRKKHKSRKLKVKKKSKRSKRKYSSEDDSSSGSESGEDDGIGRRKRRSKGKEKYSGTYLCYFRLLIDRDLCCVFSCLTIEKWLTNNFLIVLNTYGAGGPSSTDKIDIVRKEMGLDWMTRPAVKTGKSSQPVYKEQPVESGSEEVG